MRYLLILTAVCAAAIPTYSAGRTITIHEAAAQTATPASMQEDIKVIGELAKENNVETFTPEQLAELKKQGDEICKEMIRRINRKYDADSIASAIAAVQSWPKDRMSAEWRAEYERHLPILREYEHYNNEVIAFIDGISAPLRDPKLRANLDAAKFNSSYLTNTLNYVIQNKRSKNGKLVLTYGPVFKKREYELSIPYLNKRMERLQTIFKNFKMETADQTVLALDELRSELTPKAKPRQIERPKMDFKVIGPTDRPQELPAPNNVVKHESVQTPEASVPKVEKVEPAQEAGDTSDNAVKKLNDEADKMIDAAAQAFKKGDTDKANKLQNQAKLLMDKAAKLEKKIQKEKEKQNRVGK